MGMIRNSLPGEDGFRMPGEFEPQDRIWMIWPERSDNWRKHALPAQKAYVDVAKAIAAFEPVCMLASVDQMRKAENAFDDVPGVEVLEMASDDAWIRDTGPSFLVNDRGELRACDWRFNAYGGDVDGLYKPWDQDDALAGKICDMLGIDRYRSDFILEGGSFHTDGEGTILTTEMCLLSQGRNPGLTKEQIGQRLCDYLGAEKVIWLPDGIDPEETNGHVDDVACFIRPGEVACIREENPASPFFGTSEKAFQILEQSQDARGRRLKVHPVCCPRYPVRYPADYAVESTGLAIPRIPGELCAASYLNFLIVNGGVIVPQYDDPNDEIALRQIAAMFPDRKTVGVRTREIVYGGGNIHCITQQQPRINRV